MKQIKFSHNYDKLHGQKFARLLFVSPVGCAESFHKDFVEYDTVFHHTPPSWHHLIEEGRFELPTGVPMLLLVFLGDKGIPFTTVRRYSPEKHGEWKLELGNECEVVILDDQKPMRGQS